MNIYEKYLKIKTDIGTVQKTTKSVFGTAKYAKLEDILSHVNPILAENGVVITWNILKKELESEIFTFKVTLIDVKEPATALEWLFDIMPDTQNKNAVQSWGSTTTYGKRYIYGIIFDIAYEDDPDSRPQTSNPPTKQQIINDSTKKIAVITKPKVEIINAEQATVILEWIGALGINVKDSAIQKEWKDYIAGIGVKGYTQLPADMYDTVIKWFKSKNI